MVRQMNRGVAGWQSGSRAAFGRATGRAGATRYQVHPRHTRLRAGYRLLRYSAVAHQYCSQCSHSVERW